MKLKSDRKRQALKIGSAVLFVTYIMMLPALFLLPVIIAPDHSIFVNTLYDLTFQAPSAGIILNLIFVVLAIGLVIMGWGCFKGLLFQRIFLLFFGLSMIMSAWVSLHDMAGKVPQYQGNYGWHSYFITTAWLTFIILALSTSPILCNTSARLISILAGFSGLFMILLDYEAVFASGFWQRLLLIVSFGWMIYTFRLLNLSGQKKPGY